MKKNVIKRVSQGVALGVAAVLSQSVMASCKDVTRNDLEAAVAAAAAADTGGYQVPADLKMWAVMVDETGKVCHVVTSGEPGAAAGNTEWLGSRVIAAQKANTANAFSLDGYAISTANLFRTNQDGHDLYGLQHSNPVDASRAYLGSPNSYGTNGDPLKNKRIGGVNVFGGGLALYKDDGTGKNNKKIGAIGVSGDTACRDHAFAWQIRGSLGGGANGMHPFKNGPGNLGGVGGVTGDFGTGITTFNIDKDGNVKAFGATAAGGGFPDLEPLNDGKGGDVKYGDEMILADESATTTSSYWKDTWSHATCVGSIKAPGGTNIATAAKGFVLVK